MNEKQITEAIEGYTALHSNFETSRDYISLSHCHLSVDEILQQYRNGFPDSLEIRLKCYKGYQMERDLLARIEKVFGPDRVKTGWEISAFDGKVKGHPDFKFMEYPADCKSVLMDELYSDRIKALVIYESRQSGLLKSFWINANRSIQAEIDQKMKEVIRQLFK